MGGRYGSYAGCDRCGGIKVIRTTEPVTPSREGLTLPAVEWVVVKCACGRQRARYLRRKGKAKTA